MNIVRKTAAALIGFVFMLSSLFKLMDPVGTSLIVESYLHFFGIFFLDGLALPLGFALSLLEGATGIALVTLVCRRITALVSAVMTAFFTVITIILAIANPRMDCGCFGQVIHLTHLQSLIKNLILCALWCTAFLPWRDFGTSPIRKRITASVGIAAFAVFGVHFLFHNPVYDLTEFKAGTELFNPENDFEMEDCPILSFCNEDGEYADSLALHGSVAIVSVYREGVDPEKIRQAAGRLEESGYTVLMLSSAADVLPGAFKADRKTLMSLNRHNGGITYLEDGQLVIKWTLSTLPDSDTLKEIITSDPTEVMIDKASRNKWPMQALVLAVFSLVILV